MFLRCSYFFAESQADVLINSVLIKRKACKSAMANQILTDFPRNIFTQKWHILTAVFRGLHPSFLPMLAKNSLYR